MSSRSSTTHPSKPRSRASCSSSSAAGGDGGRCSKSIIDMEFAAFCRQNRIEVDRRWPNGIRRRGYRMRFTVISLTAAVLLCAGAANAASQYHIYPLGTFGGDHSEATAVNDNGL